MNLTRQFTRREQVLLLILAVLFLFAVYFLAVHIPASEAMEHIRTEYETVSVDVTVLKAKQQRMDQMRQELDAILSQPNVAEIPTYDNLQQVIGFLNTVLSSAEDYSLSFQGLQQSEDSTILRREMQMTYVSPSYPAAREVLEQLQNCPFRCQLNGLSMAPFSENGQANADAALSDGPAQVSLTVTFFENAHG